MKRTTKLLVAVAALPAVSTGVAVAASSPAVATGRATKIGFFGATLHSTVNPNGSDTGYVFQYGVTNAYGLSTNGRSAGNGTSAVHVAVPVGGLTPGTVYHYRVAALNRSGGAIGADHTFKTTGPPPAAVVTGSAVTVGTSTATVTGSVTTNGAATTWAVQYGLTSAYGSQTFGQVAASSASAVPVSTTLTGLAPATLFHYRLVAYHGTKIVTYGGDAVFFTEPLHRATSRLIAHTRPSISHHRPFIFTTAGSLRGPGLIPAFARCSGDIHLRYYRPGHPIGFGIVPVGPNCQFVIQASFPDVRGAGPTPVRIKLTFGGNGYVTPATHTDRVMVR